MVMQLMRSGASGGVLKFIIMGLIGLAIGGLALMDVRGVLQDVGGVGGQDVARIGDETIDIYEFDRTVRRSLAQYHMPPEQAYEIGLVDQVLSTQVRSYLMFQEARRLGLEIGRDQLAAQVAQIVQPNKRPEQTMQQALEELLMRQGLSESEFVRIIKREVTSEMLMQALYAGFSPGNEALTEELVKFQNQTRDINAIFFADKDIEGINPPTDEQLQRLYEKLKPIRYKIPEYRTIKMATFNPDKADIEVEVALPEIRQVYENNQDRFTISESVTLSQALVDSAEQAQAIYEATSAGQKLKEAVIAVTGSQDAYYEQTDFEVSSMLPVIEKAVAQLQEEQIAPPVETMLGHHVIRLDKRMETRVRPFDDVRGEIRQALLQEKRDEEIYLISQELDRALDEGATFEDLANNESFPLEITVLEPFDKNGLGKDEQNALLEIAQSDKEETLSLAFELLEGESSLLQELPSGELVAFSLEKREPETYRSYESVKQELANQFVADQKHAQNQEIVAKYLAELGTGGVTFEEIAKEKNREIKTFESIKLAGDMPEPLTPQAAPTIFQTPIGDYEMLEMEDQFALVKIIDYGTPDLDDQNIKETLQDTLDEVRKTVNREMKDDAFSTYLNALATRIQPKINERLLEQTYNRNQ
ncbi:MAG: peptidyl-prolyl cis-trans isomerase [Alphaproteobacteria bacterium]